MLGDVPRFIPTLLGGEESGNPQRARVSIFCLPGKVWVAPEVLLPADELILAPLATGCRFAIGNA